MQTHFTKDQLADPLIAEADGILRNCVHCGFCTATCPTFVITGDERDSPRGRIWMLREVLESPATVTADLGVCLARQPAHQELITRTFLILVVKSLMSSCHAMLLIG